ncbi:MAG: hypothetical protein COA84_12490 [Robiginitomaculum sp.]|nr:MAG: hypothetical protein COA84_12490 [Robiginitomaculum sp.]
MKRTVSRLLLSTAMAIILQTTAFAQDADDGVQEGEIIVTGIAETKGKNKIDTSISVSSISYDKIIYAAPRSLAS